MMNDRGLLQAYVRDRSDVAFQELVRRNAMLAYSCARQQLGDAHAAEDVTQSVFFALAVKAPELPRPPSWPDGCTGLRGLPRLITGDVTNTDENAK